MGPCGKAAPGHDDNEDSNHTSGCSYFATLLSESGRKRNKVLADFNLVLISLFSSKTFASALRSSSGPSRRSPDAVQDQEKLAPKHKQTSTRQVECTGYDDHIRCNAPDMGTGYGATSGAMHRIWCHIRCDAPNKAYIWCISVPTSGASTGCGMHYPVRCTGCGMYYPVHCTGSGTYYPVHLGAHIRCTALHRM